MRREPKKGIRLASLRCLRLAAHDANIALCNTPVDLVIDWETGLTVEGILFADGRYEYKDDTTQEVLWCLGR
ncbi:MAG: hypothetical protein NTY23_13640 [Chloroflexi bacterium]|nr:hypothetical protein [Chloroflexota bacterium]